MSQDDMVAKFREAFVLFSSCEDNMDVRRFVEMAYSFGIIVPKEDISDLPDIVTMDFWLDYAKKNYNYSKPYKVITELADQNANFKIDVQTFIGIMKALECQLTDADYKLLLKLTNPNNEPRIDFKDVSERLTSII